MLVFSRPKPKTVRTTRGGGFPVLVLGAEQGAIFLGPEVEATAEAYGVTPNMFAMAHPMMLEEGWETVAQVVEDWLRGNGFAT